MIICIKGWKENLTCCRLREGSFAEFKMQAVITNNKIGGKDGYKVRLEANAVESLGILKSDVCGDDVTLWPIIIIFFFSCLL